MIPLILRCQGVGLFNLTIPWKTQLLFIVMVSYVPAAISIDKFIMMSHAVCRKNTVSGEIHERISFILYINKYIYIYTPSLQLTAYPWELFPKGMDPLPKPSIFRGYISLFSWGSIHQQGSQHAMSTWFFLPRWRRKVAPLIFGILLDFFQISRCHQCALAFHLYNISWWWRDDEKHHGKCGNLLCRSFLCGFL